MTQGEEMTGAAMRDPDLVELGQHCRAIYTTDILGDPFHVVGEPVLRAAGSGDPGGERGAAGARPAAGDDRR